MLVDPVEIARSGNWTKTELIVLLYELKADLNAYLARLRPRNAPVHFAQGNYRIQRAQSRKGDALFRAGHLDKRRKRKGR